MIARESTRIFPFCPAHVVKAVMVQSPGKRSSQKGLRPLADFASTIIDPAVAKLGFGESDLVLHWREIAGERLADVSEPEKLQWPVRPKNAEATAVPEPAALILKVESAFAIEVQHLAPLLIERVNARLGWRCVGRILIRQGPVRRRRQTRPGPQPPTPEAARRAREMTSGIEAEPLRAALTRLGARALSSRRPGGAQESD